MHPIFLDTETTGLGADARLVQLAYKDSKTNEVVDEIYLPPVPISFGSMSIHHITTGMAKNKPAFEGSEDKTKLIEILKDNYLIAHNAPFDINILKNEGVLTSHFIDTLRVSQHLIESEQHKLQYLRYSLDLKTEGEITPHDALGDILVLEALYYHLEKIVKEKFGLETQEEILKQMSELTTTPILIKAFAFGKYNGKTYEEVAESDRGYLEWLLGSESSKPEIEQKEDMIYTLKHHLRR